MSHEIEYQRMAFVLPRLDGDPDRWEDRYYLFAEQGSSNCYEVSTGRRSRSWKFVDAGETWQVIRTICERAGETEGGMLTVGRNRRTKPENYIKLWRKTMADAYSASEMLDRLPLRYARLTLLKNLPELDEWELEKFQELILSDDWAEGTDYYKNTYLWRKLEGPETIDEWAKYRRKRWLAGGYLTFGR